MKLTNVLANEQVISFFLGRDDDLDLVLAEEFAGKKIIRMIQTHSDRVVFFDRVAYQQLPMGLSFLDNLDGVFTDQKDLVLVVKAADCDPILLYHPSGVIGVIHAGRVGTEKGIIKKALTMIKEEYGLAEGWQIWLGPKICRDCYQINPDTDEHYDLSAKNTEQIQAVLAGETNFAVDSGLCTFHHGEWFYSYRREGKGVPMNYGLVALM